MAKTTSKKSVGRPRTTMRVSRQIRIDVDLLPHLAEISNISDYVNILIRTDQNKNNKIIQHDNISD